MSLLCIVSHMYMEWCRSSSLIVVFGGLVFVSMLRSVVHDLKAVLMPYLLPILPDFSDMPGAYGTIAVPVGLSCVL